MSARVLSSITWRCHQHLLLEATAVNDVHDCCYVQLPCECCCSTYVCNKKLLSTDLGVEVQIYVVPDTR